MGLFRCQDHTEESCNWQRASAQFISRLRPAALEGLQVDLSVKIASQTLAEFCPAPAPARIPGHSPKLVVRGLLKDSEAGDQKLKAQGMDTVELAQVLITQEL